MSELALQRIREAKQQRLTRLDLGNCGLTELPDELFELTWLEELNLSSNLGLKELNRIGYLESLKLINISSTNVENLIPLTFFIKKGLPVTSNYYFKESQGIDVSNCPLIIPPKEIVNDGNEAILKYFDQLGDLIYQYSLLGFSKKLFDTNLTKENFEKLIQEYSDIKDGLAFFRGNDTKAIRLIESIDSEIEKYENQTFNTEAKFQTIQTFSHNIGHHVRKYVKYRRNYTVELYEAKLIIVGEGGTGKTTLYEKLKDPNHQVGNTPETHGINIHEGLEIRHSAISNQLFHANLWDFGGQELQYMTHQFFLTPRALYVLMMDARKEAPNLAYWLKIISLLGKDSQDSTEKVRLLLVFNKRQNSTGTPPQYQDTLQYYQDHLDVQYLEVDFSENDKRFENLKETIERSLVTLPIVKSQLPRKWKDVREDLRQEAKTRTHISTERLAEICSKHSITDEQDQLQLSDYLHKLGSLLHFQNDKTLINWVFLSPEWVVEGVYGFLKNDSISKQNGKFTEDDFFKILSTTKNDKNYTYTRADSAKILQFSQSNR